MDSGHSDPAHADLVAGVLSRMVLAANPREETPMVDRACVCDRSPCFDLQCGKSPLAAADTKKRLSGNGILVWCSSSYNGLAFVAAGRRECMLRSAAGRDVVWAGGVGVGEAQHSNDSEKYVCISACTQLGD